MSGRELGPDIDEGVGADAELRDLALGLDLRLGEMPALGLGDVLHLGRADPELDGVIAVLLGGAHRHDLALLDLQHRDRHMRALGVEDARHADLAGDETRTHVRQLPITLISTFTPAARSSFISASTVCGVGSTMSRSRLWVRISNCSRLFLSMCGERLTVKRSRRVGSGIGPRTRAPVRLAVLTISLADWSSTR